MESVTSIPGKIMDKIVDELLNAAVRQFGYLCKYEDNIEALSKKLQELADGRNYLQAEIDAAVRNGETIRDEVQRWMAEVKDISEAAEKFLKDEEKANTRCLGGWCINLSSRYKLSKEAETKTLAISAPIEVGVGFGKDVSLPAPPPPIISFSEGFSAFTSRELIMKQTIEALKDENISIIGICGMGGVGKTTLVKEIQKQVKDQIKMFDEVAMAVVSQTPSTTKIQDEIASWLGFQKLPGKDDPTRASSLRSRLQNAKRVLVILDDLWGRIELSDVGVPYGKDHKGCKILLTSRSRRVCNQMGAHKIFDIGTLTKEESWSLFREVAGPEVDNPEINPIAREVADECGGLPIAILTVGRALKGVDELVWKDANEQLKKSSPTNIEGMQEHVISRVGLSYDYLKSEEAKSIFLLCSCFPEDFKIPIEVLAKYGMGLMFFQNIDSMEKARGRARSLVSNLIFSFLLIDGDREGYVKMHDVVRDAAQQIASKNKFLIKAGVCLKDWPTKDMCKDAKVISLIDNNIDEVPDGLEYPNLVALLLQENIGLQFPDNLFQGMKDLNVLDLSYTKLTSLPPSFSLLSNLRTLCFCNCKFGVDLSVIGELIGLEIFDLSNSNIEEIPINFGELICLRLLDLTGCKHLKIIPQGVISRLRKLEELYMLGCINLWDSESKGDSRSDNAILIELHALSRLTSLHIFITGEVVVPLDMLSVNLTSFSIGIGYNIEHRVDEFSKIFGKRCSRALGLQPHSGGSVILAWIKNLLIRSEILVLDNFSGVESLEPINIFNELKFLCIYRCEDMKYLYKSLEMMPRVTFPKLEQLSIKNSPTFLEIYHGQLPDGCFCNVKRLDVESCDNMLIILPSHLLKSFQNLEYFIAFSCESVVYVFEFEGLEIELCSSFKELILGNLPQMTHIWKGDPQFVSLHNLQIVFLFDCPELGEALFPATLVQSLVHLEEMRVSHCRKLEEIFGRKAAGDHEREWKRREHIHTNPSLALGNLIYVSIWDCPKLRNLFTISMAKSLLRLRRLEVENCPKLKEIITATDEEEEEVGASTKKITFPCLLDIRLDELVSLSCFCSGLYNIEFPALEDLTISDCPSMKAFCYGQVMSPKLMDPWLDGKVYRWTGDINDAVKHIFNQKEEDLSEISVADIN